VLALGVLALALLLLSVPWWGRQLAFFRVRQVEVRGTRYVDPADIAARLAIDTLHSIWLPLDSLEARAARHGMVQRARVRRWLPSTLIVEVTEYVPVALVPQRTGLRAYDENAVALPLDPSRVPADLPIITAPDTGILRLLADIRSERPELFARISEIRPMGREQLRMVLIDVQVLVMRDVSAERFDELSSVERDLARRRIAPVELDLRFKDQVIARVP
jgi:cell division protein FtsQ